MNPLFPPTRNQSAKGATKWLPSNWCMLESLGTVRCLEAEVPGHLKSLGSFADGEW